MKKKILLTGSTGFVGRQILTNLLKKKIKVRAIVRKGKESFFNDVNLKIEVITTEDLFKENADWWAEQCKGIDTIIHIAWYVEPGKYLQSPKNIDCLIGSLNLAKGAVNAGVKRFVGIGTCLEYDLSQGILSVDTPLKPKSSYASAKAALFTCLSKWLPEQSVKFSWCRLFYLYGEGEDKRRLVPYILDRLNKNKTVKLTKGNQIRDYLNIVEASQIITEVALSDQEGPINVCSGASITIKQLGQQIADLYNKRYLLKFGAKPENPMDPECVVGIPNHNVIKNINEKFSKKNIIKNKYTI
jgi:nucleoside-diphosphate-sugar epimerase